MYTYSTCMIHAMCVPHIVCAHTSSYRTSHTCTCTYLLYIQVLHVHVRVHVCMYVAHTGYAQYLCTAYQQFRWTFTRYTGSTCSTYTCYAHVHVVLVVHVVYVCTYIHVGCVANNSGCRSCVQECYSSVSCVSGRYIRVDTMYLYRYM